MGVMKDLSSGRIEDLLDHGHPLSAESEHVARQRSSCRVRRVQVVLSIWDTCFHKQRPRNYEHDWSSDGEVGVRMYRHLSNEEFRVLVDVVESARSVTFDFKDVNIFMDAHGNFVRENAEGNHPYLSLVVYHPSQHGEDGSWV